MFVVVFCVVLVATSVVVHSVGCVDGSVLCLVSLVVACE